MLARRVQKLLRDLVIELYFELLVLNGQTPYFELTYIPCIFEAPAYWEDAFVIVFVVLLERLVFFLG